jgi:hypothetical protein
MNRCAASGGQFCTFCFIKEGKQRNGKKFWWRQLPLIDRKNECMPYTAQNQFRFVLDIKGVIGCSITVTFLCFGSLKIPNAIKTSLQEVLVEGEINGCAVAVVNDDSGPAAGG